MLIIDKILLTAIILISVV